MMHGLMEYEQLSFLKRFGFKVENYSNGKYIAICCTNKKYCITYHEWPQFGDFNIFITNSINDLKEYNFQHVFDDRWLYDDVLPKFKLINNKNKWSRIELVIFYLKDQLENKKDVFGIPFHEIE